MPKPIIEYAVTNEPNAVFPDVNKLIINDIVLAIINALYTVEYHSAILLYSDIK
jgi:hypothetical protein